MVDAGKRAVVVQRLNSLEIVQRRTLSPQERDRLTSILRPDLLELVWAKTEEANVLKAAVAKASFLITNNGPVTAEVIEFAPELQLIQNHGYRYENLDLRAADSAGVMVARSLRRSSASVAEHAIMLMLALSKKLLQAHSAVVQGVNPKGLPPTYTTATVRATNWALITGVQPVVGKTLGIVGLGEIGTQVAEIARPLGMRVLYHQRHPLPAHLETQWSVGYRPLEDLLAESDVVSLHCPHTPETERLIGRAEFQRMKPTAFLINTARGNIVDESALVDALAKGIIAGAGLDVFSREPIAQDSSLLELENVVLTPHIAAGGGLSTLDEVEVAFANIHRLLDGKAPEGLLVPPGLDTSPGLGGP